MELTDALDLFKSKVPTSNHMLSYFSEVTANGVVIPFTYGLLGTLCIIDEVSPRYAYEMINRIAGVKGVGNEQYEFILQIFDEVYVTGGAVVSVDKDASGNALFKHEPTATKNGKNPEFECRTNSIWYAVEVKTPKLNQYAQERDKNGW